MADAQPELATLRKTQDEIARCGRCGFCQTACPVYRVTGREAAVARGHHSHAQALLDGEIDLGEDLQPALFECLLCKACVATCFGAVKTDEVMVAARHEYIRRHGMPLSLRFVFRYMLQNPKRMARILRAAFLGKRAGVADLAERLRVLRWVSKEAAAANRLVDEVPPSFFIDRLKALNLRPANPSQRVAYFLGCGYNFALPEISELTVQALVGAGCEVTVVQNHCCGLPPYVYGDLDAARSLARKNLDTFRDLDVDAIVTECGSCYSFLKSYPTLLPEEPAAAEFAQKVREFSDFVGDRMTLAGGEDLTVTYHDPCHLSRYEDVREPPRELLRRTPGVRFVELPEADWCCGGAGTYNIFHYEQSMKILERKMANIRSTGAQVVATSCPACIVQLRHGAKVFGVPVDVLHVVQVAGGCGPAAAQPAASASRSEVEPGETS